MKIRTLKSKISLIYIFLVGIVAVIGISSVINLYRLSRSVDGLMIDNYKSIKASSQMLDALESQNTAMLDYMYSDNNKMVDMYFKSSGSFYTWYNIESNNITEAGEKEIVDKINSAYNGYLTQFSRLQNVKVKSGKKAAIDYYNSNLVGQYSSVKNQLQQLTLLNEKAMFKGKDRVTGSTKESMYLIMLLSIVLVLMGFVISGYFINKFLKPLYVLKENIKSIREGNLEQQTDINTDDEIGDLAQEFKKMTQRLMQFEKSTKGKLLEEKNRSLAIVKSISDPLIVLGTDYKVVLINNACEMFFGINEENSVGKHFLEVIKNGDIYDHIAENSSANEDKYIPKIISIMSEGKEFFFDIIVTKIRDYNSDITGFVVIFQNVTKLKKLERTKTEFVSTISHEFKTPLTSIMMGASLIKSSDVGYINEKQSEIVRTIEEDTERLSALVNDMIQLSKIESDKNIYNFEPCSIFGIIENCSRSFTELAVSKEVSIITEVDEDMPKIYADYEKISWVLNNLLSNAVKCTNAGDTITITAKTLKNNMMQVSVKDTGIGIPEEYKERIFDKFFKVYSGSSEIKGTGLGLAIAKEIVTVHKGEIWCVSKVDEGSEFIFTIPLAAKKG